MPSVSISVKGAEEVKRNMDRFLKIADRELALRMTLIVRKVAADAKRLAPVDTGRLRRNITHSVGRERTFVVGKISSLVYYSAFQEFGCFSTKATLILTKRGWTEIQYVRVKDEVLTHKNNWKKVTAVHTFNKDKKFDLGTLYEITTSIGYKINVTGNHPIMTSRGWVRADKLKKQDKVQVVYNDLPAFHYTNFTKFPTKYHEVTCPYCGKNKTIPDGEFRASITKKFFCNRECYKLYKKPVSKKFKCANCGKDLIISESYIKHHPKNENFYCNIKCYRAHKKIKTIIITCKVCNKEVERSVIRENYCVTLDRYCSVKCQRADMINENNPNYGKDHKNMHSDEFKNRQSIRYRGNNNPMFGTHTHSDIGYREDINLRVRSTWEANIARILNYKNIAWEYEPESFKLESLNTTYRPDFLIKVGNRKCYVEVKGYLTKKAQIKMDKFKELYSDNHFLLIDEAMYYKLKERYSQKIKDWEFGTTAIRGRNLKFRFDTIKKIKTYSGGKRKCYNISVDEDESFVSNHIVTHNTSRNGPHPFMRPALMENFKMIEREIKAAVLSAMFAAQTKKGLGIRKIAF